MAKSKVETFIGFCVKARKITYGSGAIDTLKNGVYLLIISADISENSKKLALKYKNRFSCPLIVCKSDFEAAVNKAGCKMAAIRDQGLARAISENADDNYEIYCGGEI